MRSILAAACATLVVVAAVPTSAADEQSVADRNVRFLLDGLGLDAIPEGVATVHTHDGVVEVSVAEGLFTTAARAGDVDLAALATGAVPPNGAFGVGDVWTLEIRYGSCEPATIITATPIPNTAFHPQAYTYAGSLGYKETSGAGIIIDWTTKGLTGGPFSNGVFMLGQSDWYCFSFFGFVIEFPYLNGYAEAR